MRGKLVFESLHFVGAVFVARLVDVLVAFLVLALADADEPDYLTDALGSAGRDKSLLFVRTEHGRRDLFVAVSLALIQRVLR